MRTTQSILHQSQRSSGHQDCGQRSARFARALGRGRRSRWPQQHCARQSIQENGADDQKTSSQPVGIDKVFDQRRKHKRTDRATGVRNRRGGGQESIEVLRQYDGRLHERETDAEAVEEADQHDQVHNVAHEEAEREAGRAKQNADEDNLPQIEVADQEAGDRTGEVGARGAQGEGPRGHLPRHGQVVADVKEEDAERSHQPEGESVDGGTRTRDHPRPALVEAVVTLEVDHRGNLVTLNIVKNN